MNATAPERIHKFELAGLGKAPFRCIGTERKVGPYRYRDPKTGIELMAGAPGQPMGSCDYCGMGIADCYKIESADGKQFVVGCECVLKTGDAGMSRAVKDLVRKAQRERRHERERVQVEEVAALMNDPKVQEALAAKPHPIPWRANQGQTLLDMCSWYMVNASTAGKVKIRRIIKKELGK
jgi:hypothetical protein